MGERYHLRLRDAIIKCIKGMAGEPDDLWLSSDQKVLLIQTLLIKGETPIYDNQGTSEQLTWIICTIGSSLISPSLCFAERCMLSIEIVFEGEEERHLGRLYQGFDLGKLQQEYDRWRRQEQRLPDDIITIPYPSKSRSYCVLV